MEIILLFLILIFFNLIIFQFNSLIAKKLNLYDKPDYKRKIHLTKVPLTGGIFLFLNYLFISILLNLNFFENLNLGFNDKREFIAIFFLVMFIFVRSI